MEGDENEAPVYVWQGARVDRRLTEARMGEPGVVCVRAGGQSRVVSELDQKQNRNKNRIRSRRGQEQGVVC